MSDLMFSKEEIIEEIIQIRKEIGHDATDVEIKELIYENDEITIIAPDRPEKSIIIGKGGWVVGKLREKLNVKSIHVISYTDILLKEYQLDLSKKYLRKLLDKKIIPNEYEEVFENIYTLISLKHEAPYDNQIITSYIKDNINCQSHEKAKVSVALSGGADSSFSLLLAKALGFNVEALTVDPGTIVLPKQFKFNIENLTSSINVPHEYLKTDMSNIIGDALNGKIHPCGRCSNNTLKELEKHVKKEEIHALVFGDLLSTSSQSIVMEEDYIKINMPALFRMEKTEVKNIISEYDVKKISGFGCPLIVEVHKKYPYYKQFSIQRVLREIRAGILEPGEALDLIKTI